MTTTTDTLHLLLDAIREGMEEGLARAMPSDTQILDALTPPNPWTVVPHGSHLHLLCDGKWIEGADIVAIRDSVVGVRVEALTNRGCWTSLDETTNLVIGPVTTNAAK